VSARELVVLGTASQVPTRERNHNGCFLRWDTEGVLFDPGEGTQRQLILAGLPASAITRICVTHFHGDHCLGLAGIFQRLSLDGVVRPVPVYFPAGGQPYFERLRGAAVFHESAEVHPRPVAGGGDVDDWPGFTLSARRLDHGTETLGWRLVEPDGRRMLPERLEALGVHGPDISRLQREGSLVVKGRRVRLGEVTETRPGQRFAFVMDTRLCDAAFELAEGVDLLVCESTYLQKDAALARDYGHLTAAQAARIALEAGARRLVLTHFSQRYPDASHFLEEAAAVFPEVVVARDLLRVPVPSRR
jgi:ribonuclease Z